MNFVAVRSALAKLDRDQIHNDRERMYVCRIFNVIAYIPLGGSIFNPVDLHVEGESVEIDVMFGGYFDKVNKTVLTPVVCPPMRFVCPFHKTFGFWKALNAKLVHELFQTILGCACVPCFQAVFNGFCDVCMPMFPCHLTDGATVWKIFRPDTRIR